MTDIIEQPPICAMEGMAREDKIDFLRKIFPPVIPFTAIKNFETSRFFFNSIEGLTTYTSRIDLHSLTGEYTIDLHSMKPVINALHGIIVDTPPENIESVALFLVHYRPRGPGRRQLPILIDTMYPETAPTFPVFRVYPLIYGGDTYTRIKVVYKFRRYPARLIVETGELSSALTQHISNLEPHPELSMRAFYRYECISFYKCFPVEMPITPSTIITKSFSDYFGFTNRFILYVPRYIESAAMVFGLSSSKNVVIEFDDIYSEDSDRKKMAIDFTWNDEDLGAFRLGGVSKMSLVYKNTGGSCDGNITLLIFNQNHMEYGIANDEVYIDPTHLIE